MPACISSGSLPQAEADTIGTVRRIYSEATGLEPP